MVKHVPKFKSIIITDPKKKNEMASLMSATNRSEENFIQSQGSEREI